MEYRECVGLTIVEFEILTLPTLYILQCLCSVLKTVSHIITTEILIVTKHTFHRYLKKKST